MLGQSYPQFNKKKNNEENKKEKEKRTAWFKEIADRQGVGFWPPKPGSYILLKVQLRLY